MKNLRPKKPYSVANYWSLKWLIWDLISDKIKRTGLATSRRLASGTGKLRPNRLNTHSWRLRSRTMPSLTKAGLLFRWFWADKKRILVAVLIIIVLWPGRSSVIYAEPDTLGPVPTVRVPKDVNKLPPPRTKPLSKVKAISTPKSKPVVKAPARALGGCVSGYSVGSYALNQLIQHESSGNSCATNAGGCFGLLQACPGYPLRAACGGNPSCQIDWFARNKLGGYGSWENAWAMWQSRYPHWW